MARLRLHLDGDWDALEFADFFEELHNLHDLLSMRFRTFGFDSSEPAEPILQISRRARPLRVRRIRYGSEGFTDLLGLGALLREVREFVQFLITHFSERELRELGREDRRIAIAQAKLDFMIKLRKERLITDEEQGRFKLLGEAAEFFEIPKFEEIANAIIEGRLKGAELSDEENDS